MASPAGFPAPGAALQVTFAAWPAGKEFSRIHRSTYGPTQFNPTTLSNARFSPIREAGGAIIPTLYGGTTFECAAMETVFHDVSHAPGPKTYAKTKLDGQCISIVQPTRDLNLVDLSAKALRKLDIKRSDLIDSEAADYVNTRPWAEALHVQCGTADGLLWVSRQDDTARALVLFGDRVNSSDLKAVAGPTVIVSDTVHYQKLQELALTIGVNIV